MHCVWRAKEPPSSGRDASLVYTGIGVRCSRSYYTCVWLLLRRRIRRRLGMDGQERHHAGQGKPGDAQGGTLRPMKAHSLHPCKGKKGESHFFYRSKVSNESGGAAYCRKRRSSFTISWRPSSRRCKMHYMPGATPSQPY